MAQKQDDQKAAFVADGMAKIDALFADAPGHASASIGDVKALGAVILGHIANPEPAGAGSDGDAPAEPAPAAAPVDPPATPAAPPAPKPAA